MDEGNMQQVAPVEVGWPKPPEKWHANLTQVQVPIDQVMHPLRPLLKDYLDSQGRVRQRELAVEERELSTAARVSPILLVAASPGFLVVISFAGVLFLKGMEEAGKSFLQVVALLG